MVVNNSHKKYIGDRIIAPKEIVHHKTNIFSVIFKNHRKAASFYLIIFHCFFLSLDAFLKVYINLSI